MNLRLVSFLACATALTYASVSIAAGVFQPPGQTPFVTTPFIPDATEASGLGNEGGIHYELDRRLADKNHEKELAKMEAKKLVNAAGLACEQTDTRFIGSGSMSVGSEKLAVKVYEVACSNGLGYILFSQATKAPQVISCFAARTGYDAAVAQGGTASLNCELPANADVKASAAALMAAANASCQVSNLRSIGVSETNHLEYLEVACADGTGSIVEIQNLGSPSSSPQVVNVASCKDASLHQGLPCQLSDNGPESKPVTMRTYLTVIKQNGIKCEPTQFRLIGREVVDKRYVVEVQCPEQPDGLIAFIPLEGNANKFEAIDCNTAMERQIACKLTVPR